MRTTSLRLRAALALAVTITLALGVAACGSDDANDVSSAGSTTRPAGPSTTEPSYQSAPSTGPVDPDAPVSSPPGAGDPIDDSGPPLDTTPVDPADAEVLVGLPLARAEAEALHRGWTVRVARQDGEDLALTDDYSPTRVNVAVQDDVVTEVVSIG